MGKTAFIFPGQGAQSVGMGKDVYDSYESTRALFAEADEVLSFALSDIIFNGPEEELKQTYYTQPALVTVSIALLQKLREKGITPDFCAGHSLGEYSALVAAGSLSFADAVRIVHLRGTYMNKAVPAGQGTMAAVLGAEREQLALVCREISEQGSLVELANVNCPGQIVVSGSANGVNQLRERAAEAGAKRVIPLEVSGPFHSSMMVPAAEQLTEALAEVTITRAEVPVISNVTAKPVQAPEEIRQRLIEQVTAPVLWEDSVRWLLEQGTNHFVEIGSGKVLSGLVRKIDRSVKVTSISDLTSLEAYLKEEGYDA